MLDRMRRGSSRVASGARDPRRAPAEKRPISRVSSSSGGRVKIRSAWRSGSSATRTATFHAPTCLRSQRPYTRPTSTSCASAIGVLERNHHTLVDRDLPWLITLVRKSKSWAYVDWIAPKVIGNVIARDPRARRRLPVWARDQDFWVRRAALLAEHDALRAGGGDFALWSRLAAPMLDEREFFIRKAIGWVLREVSKKRPALSYEFLRKHQDRVSRLSMQEGAKYLPAAERKALGLPAAPAWMAREAKRKVASRRS